MTASAGTALSLSAPAKINLGLRIVGRRPDGYHLLESLFVPIGLADQVELQVLGEAATGSGKVAFEMAGSGAPAGSDNLAARAACAFLEASGLALNVRVGLQKQIPMGAGLGGGSSDAGAVLRGLDELRPGALSPASLRDLALGLGADIPFFLAPEPALVAGVGEQIEPMSGLPGLWLLLIGPGVSLATAEVYAEFDRLEGALTPAPSRSTLRPLASLGGFAGAPGAFAQQLGDGRLQNDLEAAALRLCPQIRDFRERLEAVGALAVGMSGGGATFFGVFSDRASAESARSRVNVGTPAWARVAAMAGSR